MTSPTGVSAAPGDTQVTISWNAVPGATGYNIYWSTTPGVTQGTGTLIAGVTSPHVHPALTNGLDYYYIVTAFDPSVESVDSAEATARPGVSFFDFNMAGYTVSESGASVLITVTRGGSTTGIVGVNYATSDGTATAGVDYSADSGTLSWPDGDGSSRTFLVPISLDLLAEGDETVNLTLSVPTGSSVLGSQNTAVLTIQDDDASLSLDSATYSVVEGVGTATITVNRVGGTIGVVGVTYTTSDGTATSAVDYSAASGTLSWADGDGAPKTFNISITDDALIEGDETVNIALSSPTGGVALGAPSSAVLTIVDDETTLQLSAATTTVNEDGGFVTLTVTRAGTTTGAVSVNIATSDGTATGGADYATASGTLSWGAGDGAPKTFNVTILDDVLVEGDETINIALGGPTGGATVGSPAGAVLTILDNDSAVQLGAATASVSESGGLVTITVTRAGSTAGAASVNYATSDGSATAGSDYAGASGTLAWADGDGADKSFTITITSDGVVEGDETVNIALSGPVGNVTLGSPSMEVLTIIDDDTSLQFDVATGTINENSGSATLTVTRLGDIGQIVSVNYGTGGGTGTAGVDYTATSGTLNWGAGDGASKTFTVTLIDDAIAESAETVNLNLGGATGGATVGAPATFTLTILDDDGTPTLSIDDITVVEGDSA